MVPVGLTKLNNAEYVNLATRMQTLANAAGAEALGVPQSDLDRYAELITLFNDLIAQSRVAPETAELNKVAKQRGKIMQYLIDTPRIARTSPVTAMAEAGEALSIIMKPYMGFYNQPVGQQTVIATSMLLEVNKEANAAHIVTLGLTDAVAQLSSANAKYQILTDQRTATRLAAKQENSDALRKEMDELFDYLTSVAFAKNVISPTDASTQFALSLNQVLSEVNAAYNMRTASAKKEDDTVAEGTPATGE